MTELTNESGRHKTPVFPSRLSFSHLSITKAIQQTLNFILRQLGKLISHVLPRPHDPLTPQQIQNLRAMSATVEREFGACGKSEAKPSSGKEKEKEKGSGKGKGKRSKRKKGIVAVSISNGKSSGGTAMEPGWVDLEEDADATPLLKKSKDFFAMMEEMEQFEKMQNERMEKLEKKEKERMEMKDKQRSDPRIIRDKAPSGKKTWDL